MHYRPLLCLCAVVLARWGYNASRVSWSAKNIYIAKHNMLILILSGHCKYYRSNNQSEGLVAPADYGSPLCEWLVGWASQPIFSYRFFSFLSGQVMLLVTSDNVLPPSSDDVLPPSSDDVLPPSSDDVLRNCLI